MRETTTDASVLANQLQAALRKLEAANRRVSELEAAEIERERAQERYRNLYEHIPAMYFKIGTDGTVRSVNAHGAAELGYRSDELVGQSVLGVFHEDDRAAVREQLEHALGSPGGVAHWEFRKVRKDGTVLWVEEAVRAVPDVDGSTVLLVVCEDVTWRKEAEQKLIRQQEELRALSSRLALTEERERRRVAERVHDEIGQVLAMARIKVGEAVQNAGGKEPLAGILTDARELLDASIETMRNLSGELSSPVLYDLGLDAGIHNLCERIAERSNLRCTCKGDKYARRLLDQDTEVLMFRVARELLYNVVKHANAKQVNVTISLEGDRLCITVEDDGIGFDASSAGLTFDPACGYGLFSVRKNLEVLGGAFEIDSEQDRGTRVIVSVPLVKAARQAG